jgi:hypothetical protein
MAKTAAATLKALRANLVGLLRHRKATVAKFAKDVVRCPAYTMTWGTDAVRAAADILVYEEVRDLIDTLPRAKAEHAMTPQQRLEHIEHKCHMRLRLGAMDPPRSTSVMSNLIDTYRTAAWATVLDQLEWM